MGQEAKWAPAGLPTSEELGEEEERMQEVSRGNRRRETREECKSGRRFCCELRALPTEERARKRKTEKGTSDFWSLTGGRQLQWTE